MVRHFLNKVFGNKKSSYTDFSWLGTDMHSHLIPGIDDGSQSMDESLKLIREMKEMGFNRLVTTPHVMSDYFRNTRQIIQSGLEKLRSALIEEELEMEITAAAEYYFDEEFLKKLATDELMTFGNRYVLFELSYINLPENFQEVVFNLQVKGYKPVLAHPERYPFWVKKTEEYMKLHNSGLLLQLNINSLSGYYGPQIKSVAEKMVDMGVVSFVGSDLHNMRHIESLKKSVTMKYIDKLAEMDLLNKTI
jgi:protein-tyrosine phosphatase